MANQVTLLEQATVTRSDAGPLDGELEPFFEWEIDHKRYIDECEAERCRSEEERRQAAEVADYYVWLEGHNAWLERCEAARLAVQDKYRKNPGHSRAPYPDGMPWLAEGLSDEKREATRQAYYTEQLTQLDRVVSWPALMAARSLAKARILDEFMWYHIGDSASATPEKDHLWKAMRPNNNELDDHFDYAYTDKVLSAFSLTGQLIHIRKTTDPEAATPQDKYTVFTANMETQEASRLYVQSVVTSPSATKAHHFDETWTLSHQKEPFVRERLEVKNDPLEAAYWRAHDARRQLTLPRLIRSAEGYTSFTPGNGVASERLRDIDILTRQRRLLGMYALASGKYETTEQGVLMPKQGRRLHAA